MKNFYNYFTINFCNYLYNPIWIIYYNFIVKICFSEMLIQLLIPKQKELLVDVFFMIIYVNNTDIQKTISINVFQDSFCINFLFLKNSSTINFILLRLKKINILQKN